jgi:hypothetical protein
MVAPSRLQDEHPFPGETVPKYRYIWKDLPDIHSIAGAMAGLGGGAATSIESNASGLGGVRIEATTDDTAFMVAFPYDCDVERAIDFRVWWNSDETTAADSYTWDINYIEILGNTTAVAVPATALGTQVAADTNSATAHAMQITAWGSMTAGTLNGNSADGYLHLFEIDPSAVGGTPSSDIVVLWAVQIRYQPLQM